jgi:hypothetical protein
MYHKRLNWLWFFAQGEKRLLKAWVGYGLLPKGKKDPVYSIQSGSKVAHYIQVVQKSVIWVRDLHKRKHQIFETPNINLKKWWPRYFAPNSTTLTYEMKCSMLICLFFINRSKWCVLQLSAYEWIVPLV